MRRAVATVIASWTGVPVRHVVKNEIEAVLALDEALKRRIIGQDHALEMVARRIQTSRAGLDNPSKPIGVFLLCGPSGVGKTETALALAELLYGGEERDRHQHVGVPGGAHRLHAQGRAARLCGLRQGRPPDRGGAPPKPYRQWTARRGREGAPDVHEIFFQVFDKGVMEDSEGRRIDFKNT